MNASSLWRRLCRRGGSAAVEYALILPIMLLFVIGIIDVGRLMWTFNTLNRATEAAARCGAIDTVGCGTSANIQNRGVTEAWGMTILASAFTVTTATCGVKVVGAYDFIFAIPALATTTPLGTVTLKATACYPKLATP